MTLGLGISSPLTHPAKGVGPHGKTRSLKPAFNILKTALWMGVQGAGPGETPPKPKKQETPFFLV